ncbi:hypothetical protein Bpfe_010869 [Biomphalaria pfeifferi]|uniref:THD domain-containing protein n=1 Tax=Biomphalaria pfeifferi TaxID=112525 RepID=A0AAD8BSA4_BIOPF|nr:hypothetical protein Bpfe_010869 [Biomphalaria pfeifferi]
MAANTISEYWNFLPAYILRPRHSKHSTESSSYSWGSSTFSLRTGSYFTETAVRQETRGAQPLPPPRKINAAQQLALSKAKTGTGNLVSLRKKLRVKGSSHSRDSNYHQIKNRGLLCQRRVLAIFSVFTFCVSLCTVLLLGFQISVLFRKLLPEAIHQREDAITRHYNSSNEDYLPTSTVTARHKSKLPKQMTNTLVIGYVYFKSFSSSENCSMGEKKLTIDYVNQSLTQPGYVYNMNANEQGLTIITSGYYYVFSSILFYIEKEPSTKAEPWKHFIKKGSKGILSTMSEASYTCGFNCSKTNRSSYLAGLFHLCRDDVIKVHVCGIMSMYNHFNSTFLGLFRTSETPDAMCLKS